MDDNRPLGRLSQLERLASRLNGRTHWLLVSSILLALVSPRVAEILFVLYVLASAVRVPWRRRFTDRRTVGMLICLVLAIAWTSLRVEKPWGSGLHTWRSPQLYPVTLLDYVPYFVAFLVLSLSRFPVAELKRVLWALAATVPICFSFAVAELRGVGPVVWAWGPEWLPLLELTVYDRRHRLSAALYNSNGLGEYMLFTCLACLVLLTVEEALTRSERWAATLRRITLGTLLALSLWMLMLSGSRSAWLTVTMLLVIFSVKLRIRPRYILVPLLLWWSLLGLARTDLGFPSAVARWALPDVVWTRLAPGASGSNVHRIEIFRCALELSTERPLLGWGLGSMAPECERRLENKVNHAHNLFLQLSSELGMPFAIFLSCLMFWVFFATGRKISGMNPGEEHVVNLGLWLIGVGVVALSQTALALAHSNGLEVVFWFCLAAAYSLVAVGSDAANEPKQRPDPVLEPRTNNR